MPTPYVTVFQITQRLPNGWFACVGLLPFVAGVVMIWGKHRFKWAQPYWLFAIFLCLFGAAWVAGVGTTTISDDLGTFEAYQKGDYRIVEGLVADFQPMPYQGHQEECFSVRNQRFCYSDYVIAHGFHNATSHGGPIHEGLPVRIAYRDGNILRLEIPQDQVPSSAQAEAARADGERQWQKQSEADPTLQRMNTGFLFTILCWTAWGSVQWQKAMRFWAKPPVRLGLQYLFRTLFALCFCGTAIQFTHNLMVHPITRQTVGPTVLTAIAMCAVVAAMTTVVLWMAERRNRNSFQTEIHNVH